MLWHTRCALYSFDRRANHPRLQILKQILEAKEKMGDTMKTSFFSMTEAKYAAGENIKHTIFDNVETAQVQYNQPQPCPQQPNFCACGTDHVAEAWGACTSIASPTESNDNAGDSDNAHGQRRGYQDPKV